MSEQEWVCVNMSWGSVKDTSAFINGTFRTSLQEGPRSLVAMG